MAFNTGRSGDEPLHARSALRLRLALAGWGLASAIAGIVVFTVWSVPALLGLFAAVAAIALVNAAVIVRHIRAGDAYQPGPEVPPYRPAHVEAPPPRPERAPTPPGARHARFIVAALVALVIIVNAWTWIWRLSVTASVVLTIVAAVLLLFGVIASNAGSPALRGNAVPDLESERGIPDADSDADADTSESRAGERNEPESDTADTDVAGTRSRHGHSHSHSRGTDHGADV